VSSTCFLNFRLCYWLTDVHLDFTVLSKRLTHNFPVSPACYLGDVLLSIVSLTCV
jgi:hypothetical protein